MAKSNKRWVKKTTRENTYLVYLKLINGMLNLTNKELEVAAALYDNKFKIDGVITDNKTANEFLFSIQRRKEMRDKLGMSSLLFNNHLQSLKKKKVVLEKDGVKMINPHLEIVPNRDLTITFQLDVEKLPDTL